MGCAYCDRWKCRCYCVRDRFRLYSQELGEAKGRSKIRNKLSPIMEMVTGWNIRIQMVQSTGTIKATVSRHGQTHHHAQSEIHLSASWSEHQAADGRKYWFDSNTGTTHWADP